METSGSSTRGGETPPPLGHRLPEYVDWIAATVIALAGLALTVAGSFVTLVVDRAMLRDGIESGQVSVVVVERELTRAEMLDFVQVVVSWTGVGLLVTGLALVLFAIGYLVTRHRTHQQTPDDESAGTYRAHAVVGAVATTVLSFIPFSSIAGGAIAGYLEGFGTGRSVSVGALSGFLAVLPGLVILVFVTVGIVLGTSAVGETGFGVVVVGVVLLVMLFAAAWGAGLGALGGVLGGRFAEQKS